MGRTFKTIGKVILVFVILATLFIVFAYIQNNSWKKALQSNRGNEDIIKKAEELPCNVLDDSIFCSTNKNMEELINAARKYNASPSSSYKVQVYKDNTRWDGGITGSVYYDFNGNKTTREECISKLDEFVVVQQLFNTDFYLIDGEYKSGGRMDFGRHILFNNKREAVCQLFYGMKMLQINY